ELCKVRKHEGHLRRLDTEPVRERCAVLIERRCRNPPAVRLGVVRTAAHELRKFTVEIAAIDRTAEHEGMTSPSVIGATSRRGLERAAEFGQCERRYAFLHAKRHGRIVERLQSMIEIREQFPLAFELRFVGIEAAELNEENLSPRADDAV